MTDPLDPLTRMTTERDLWREHYHAARERADMFHKALADAHTQDAQTTYGAFKPAGEMSNVPHHIRVWRFEDAPEELRNLSTNGGDEDWVALVPPRLRDTYISWLQPGRGGLGMYCVNRYEHPELPEYTVCIGCHA
mgnify:CR=1 FL=1